MPAVSLASSTLFGAARRKRYGCSRPRTARRGIAAVDNREPSVATEMSFNDLINARTFFCAGETSDGKA